MSFSNKLEICYIPMHLYIFLLVLCQTFFKGFVHIFNLTRVNNAFPNYLFAKIFHWKALRLPDEFLDVVFDEHSGRTDRLSRSC